MTWFYAHDENRSGPMTATELAEAARRGTVTADTLAWKEGMSDWLPFRKVAGQVFAESMASGGESGEEAPRPVETASCAHSNRVLPRSELVPYGDRWIDPEQKDAFVQQLMESGNLRGDADIAVDRIPVGFWWRLLSYIIDYFVVLIPSMLCMIPFWISSATVSMPNDPEDPFAGWTALIWITYAIGVFGSMLVNGGYHTWMVGKYRATVGKMAIGAVISNPDGSAIGYGKSFGRWAAQTFVNGLIIGVCVAVATFLGAMIMAAVVAASGEDAAAGALIGGIFVMMGSVFVGLLLGMFPYWMAGFDAEKRALHDRICATRVERSNIS